MNTTITLFLIYGVPVAVIVVIYTVWTKLTSAKARRRINEAIHSGLSQPASLHPVIDPNKCLGCATCVTACPEGDILGLINRKAQLVAPASCIGHGACKEACPVDAISLVFGTESRGVDIPNVSPSFETNVPGLYIAGELGGMGLIKNAISQGVAALNSLHEVHLGNVHGCKYDVVIVGAGPAGLSAALAAKEKKLKYVLLEQDTVGGTLAHYPRGKIVMTQPATLPIVGKFQFKEASKESLIEFWQGAIKQSDLKIESGTRVDEIESEDEGFSLITNKHAVVSRTVLLALGRRGTPRTLGVPGEEHEKVVYRLVDAAQYRGKHVLVVGGGDSALEAALSLSEEADTVVSLSYRSGAFSRAKQKNRDRIDQAEKDDRLNVYLTSTVNHITPSEVSLETQSGPHVISNDFVIVCAGGILPTAFLKKSGIEIETKFGTA